MADIFLKITLKSEYTGSGSNPGPFTIVAQPGGKTFNNVTKESLAAGHYIQVPDTVTGGTITATGVCTNSIPWLAPSTGTANCSSVLGFGTIDTTCADNNTKTNYTINVTGNGTSPVELSYDGGTTWLSADAGTTNKFTIRGISNDGNNFTFKVRLKNCTTEFTKTISKCTNIATLCQTKIGWGDYTKTCDYDNDTTTFKLVVTGATATTPIQFSKDNGQTWDTNDTNKPNEKTYVLASTQVSQQQYFKARISGCTATTTNPISPIEGNITKCLTEAPTTNACSTLTWDTSKNTSSYVGTTKTFTVYVNNNNGLPVEFSLDNITYKDADDPINNNKFTFTKTCTAADVSVGVYARIKGCKNQIYGTVTTYCGGEGQYSYGVSLTDGGQIKIGNETITQTTVIKRTSASIDLNGSIITAKNGFRIVSYTISAGAATSSRTVTMGSNVTTYTITEGTMSSTTNDYQTLSIAFAPINGTGTPSFTLTKENPNCLFPGRLKISGTPGSKVRYSTGSSFTGTNSCDNPDGVIGNDGTLTIEISDTAFLNQSTTYTVRVYNGGDNCSTSVYTDKSITLDAVNCPPYSQLCQYGDTKESACQSPGYTLFFSDGCNTATTGCTVYTKPSRNSEDILSTPKFVIIQGTIFEINKNANNGIIGDEVTDYTCGYQQ